MSALAVLIVLIAQILLIFSVYLEVKRVGVPAFCSNFLNITDIIFFILSLQFLGYLILSVDATQEAIRNMDTTPSNWYVGFGDVADSRNSLKISGSLLTFLVMCRLLMFLYYVPQARMVFLTMKLAGMAFANLFLIIILLSFVSASLVYINLNSSLRYSETWSTCFVVFFLLPFGLRPDMDKKYLEEVGNISYIIYVMTFFTLRLLINSLVIVILVRNFRKAHHQVRRRKLNYSIIQYFKERIMKHPNDFECYRAWYDSFRRRRMRAWYDKQHIDRNELRKPKELKVESEESFIPPPKRRYKFKWCWFL